MAAPLVAEARAASRVRRRTRATRRRGECLWLPRRSPAVARYPALYSSNWQVPWHIFLTKPFAQHRPHGVSGPITVGPPSTAGGHRPLCAARGQSRRQGHVRGLRARQRVFLARPLGGRGSTSPATPSAPAACGDCGCGFAGAPSKTGRGHHHCCTPPYIRRCRRNSGSRK